MKGIWKSIGKHKLSNILMVLQICLAFVYFFMTMTSIQQAFNICVETPKVLGDRWDSIIHCEVEDEGTDMDDFIKFCNELKKKHLLDEMAFYNANVPPVESDYFGNGAIANLQMELGISQMADLQVKEGRCFRKSDLQEEIPPLLVGDALAKEHHVKIGDVISGDDVKYRIVGILKEHSRWFLQSISEGLILSLDKQVVSLVSESDSEEYVRMHYYGSAGSRSEAKAAAKTINEMAKGYHVILRAETVEEEISQQFDSILNENMHWLLFSIIIMFMAAIGTASLAVAHLHARKREVGVRMAVGYSPGKIFFLFAGEVALLMILSYVLACICICIYTGNGIEVLGGFEVYTGYAFSGSIALIGGIGIFCMCLPSVMALSVAIRTFQPNDLMGGKE